MIYEKTEIENAIKFYLDTYKVYFGFPAETEGTKEYLKNLQLSNDPSKAKIATKLWIDSTAIPAVRKTKAYKDLYNSGNLVVNPSQTKQQATDYFFEWRIYWLQVAPIHAVIIYKLDNNRKSFKKRVDNINKAIYALNAQKALQFSGIEMTVKEKLVLYLNNVGDEIQKIGSATKKAVGQLATTAVWSLSNLPVVAGLGILAFFMLRKK